MFLIKAAVVAGLALAIASPELHGDAFHDYGQRGAYVVGVKNFTIEGDDYPLNATLWYPAVNLNDAEQAYTYELNGLVMEGQALADAMPEKGDAPYPLIVYSHGLFGARFESTHYAEHLASWGFVVIAADHPGSTFFDTTSAQDVVRSFGTRAHEVARLVDHAEAINAEGAFAGMLDMEAVGISGFSFGGYTALLASGASLDSAALAAACQDVTPEENVLCDESSQQLLAESFGLANVPQGLWPAAADQRIRAVVALAPCCVNLLGAEGLAGVAAPLLVMGGTADVAASPEQNGMIAFEEASSPARALALIENAGHEVYLDIYSGEIARAHELIRYFATAFFLSQLRGDTQAAALLDPAAVDFPEITYTAEGMDAR
jgi:predicted dienelactone hydrolase